MRIAVVIEGETGSVFAPVVNTFKMAHGFAELGHAVTIVCQRGTDADYSQEQLNKMYGIDDSIEWTQIRLPHVKKKRKAWLFALLCLPMLHLKKFDLIYARNYLVSMYSPKLGLTTIMETHAYVDEKRPVFLRTIEASCHRNFRAIITISDHLADYYSSLGTPCDKILVLPTGVNVEAFLRPEQLPPSPYNSHKPNITYMGHLYDWKGIPTILDVASMHPEYEFHLVGGYEEDQIRHQKSIASRRLENVTLHGMKTQEQIPPYLWHANVVLLPPSGNHPTAKWTSPVKLGEYLASGTPVVASSIPALVHWLNDTEVEFFIPDDPDDLSRAIQNVLCNRELSAQRIKAGIAKAYQFSYENRARSILSSFNTQ